MIPGKMVKGMGGAMDLVAGVQARHRHHGSMRQGRAPRSCCNRCTLPLTGSGVIDMVITDLGVFEIDKVAASMVLIELADGVSLDEIAGKTEATYTVADGLRRAGGVTSRRFRGSQARTRSRFALRCLTQAAGSPRAPGTSGEPIEARRDATLCLPTHSACPPILVDARKNAPRCRGAEDFVNCHQVNFTSN